jgi:hypothetical protein
MMTPEPADRAAYVRSLILARCPELTDADLALIGIVHPAAPSAEMLPVEIGEQIMDAIVALENKVDWLAEAVAVGANGEDDADATRRRAGA